MSLSKKADYVAQGLDRLLQQYKDKPKIAGLVEPWLVWFQKYEDILWEIITLRYISTGEGVQLDTIGKILGAPRPGGMTDANYKVRLKAQGVILRSDGTPPKVETVLVLCCPFPFSIDESYVATLIVELTPAIDTSTFDVFNLFDVVRQTKTGGVRLELIYTEDEDDFLFAEYDPDDPLYEVPIFDSEHGLGDAGDTLGGRLATTITQ